MATAGKAKVLVVDDDPQVRQMLVLALKMKRWDVSQAADGEEALRLVRDNPPDILLLDQRMPGLLGTELYQRLRQEGFEIPAVLVTAAAEGEALACAAGIAHFLGKPINLFHLEELLERLASPSVRNSEMSVPGR